MASNWTVIATFETYEKARDYVENLPRDTNDNAIKEFKIKVVHSKFAVKSRYDPSLAGTVEDLENTIRLLERSTKKRKNRG